MAIKLGRLDTFSEELSSIRSEESSITRLQGTGGKQDLESDMYPHNACTQTVICLFYKVPKRPFVLK